MKGWEGQERQGAGSREPAEGGGRGDGPRSPDRQGGSPNFEQYQLIRNESGKAQGPGWLSILKETLAPLWMHESRNCPKLCKNIRSKISAPN